VITIHLVKVVRQHEGVLHAHAIIVHIKKVLVYAERKGKEVKNKLMSTIGLLDGCCAQSRHLDFLGVQLHQHDECF
jgi:hypothetical protein